MTRTINRRLSAEGRFVKSSWEEGSLELTGKIANPQNGSEEHPNL